jgi:hypothetical protein
VLDLASVELQWSAYVAATATRRCDACVRALDDQTALELRDGTEDCEHQLARGGGGVDRFGKRHKVYVTIAQFLAQLEQVGQRSSQAIKPPDHERVSWDKLRKRSV